MGKSNSNHKFSNPLLQVIKKFIGKLNQHADVYPIRYYKKNRRFRRHDHQSMVK